MTSTHKSEENFSVAPPVTSFFGVSGYWLYLATRGLSTCAITMVNLVVAWSLYDVSSNPLYLGLAGLILFLPSLLLLLVTGMVVDRFDRRRTITVCYLMMSVVAILLFSLAKTDRLEPVAILSLLVFLGIARAFYLPTAKALLVNMVQGRELTRAIAVNSSLTKIAVITGPILGGLLYAVSPAVPLAVAAIIFLFSAVTASLLRGSNQVRSTARFEASDLLAGVRAIKRDPALLGLISLDFAVMFISGATALLPVFAKDILGTDAAGLGLLRSAPAAGAFAMAVWLSWFPIRRRAGALMLLALAGYGMTMVVFGLSTHFWLSWMALLSGGMLDMIGFNVRETMIQMRTPDALRGRVTAVNTVVVGASNELGDFRAGTFAFLFGAVPAVLLGGGAAIAITATWYRYFPQIRRIDNMG